MPVTKHTLVALVEDKPGVLNRMASVFRRRGFNIESINVLETINTESSELPHLSRVAIVVGGSTAMLEQLRKHLENIVDVVKVTDITTKGIY
ncbi:MAG: acetolactate synthase small subunit [Dehalococcoidales bacterium]|nr:acetolactate synthase small subunit [Dehalococcoidales bacterium]